MQAGKKGAIEIYLIWHVFFIVRKNTIMGKSLNKSSLIGENKKRSHSKQKSTSKGKTSKEIVKRHLSDENDKITEDDLKHLKIDLSIPKDKAHRPLKIKKGKERPKDEEKDNTTLTPWDVISE